MAKDKLTEKQKKFCKEYIYDWNGTRSYRVAYPDCKTDNAAGVAAYALLRNPKIEDYIALIQKDLEKLAGISRQMVLNEHMKLAFSSIAHLHNTWIERKEFENLSDEQKECIAEIDTKIIRKVLNEINSSGEIERVPYDIEYIKIKLYDKQKALDSIGKMLGYNEAEKIQTETTIQYKNVSKQFPKE